MKRNYIILFLFAITSLLIWYTFRRQATQQCPASDSIIVGTNAEYQPFTFIKNKEIVGLDIDIAQEVCNRLGKKMILRDMAFTALIPALQIGNVQIAAAGMTPSPARAQHVFFTQPYLKGDKLLIVNQANNPPLKTVADLNEKKVVVNEGYVSDAYMSTKKGPELIRLSNPAAGFLALKTGRAQAFVIAASSAQPFFQKHGKDQFNVHEIEGTGNEYALAVSKKYDTLHADIQKVLDAMIDDGTIQKIKTKWGFK